MASWALPSRRDGPLLHAAPRGSSRPGSPLDHHLPSYAHPLPEFADSRLLAPVPMALYGACCVRGDAVLRRYDRHNSNQRVSARLLPRRLRRGQCMDHGQPQLGWLHGDVHPDRVGHAARPGESLGHPGRHHIHLHFLNTILAIVRKTDEKMAGPNVVWREEPVFIERLCYSQQVGLNAACWRSVCTSHDHTLIVSINGVQSSCRVSYSVGHLYSTCRQRALFRGLFGCAKR